MVFNNATDPDGLVRFVPAAVAVPNHHHQPSVGRQRAWTSRLRPCVREAEALAFLARRTGRPDKPGARQLAEELRSTYWPRPTGTARIGTGWQAGPETPEQAAKVVAAIKAAAAEEGRTIDDDHYGAGIPFRFGRPNDPGLDRLFEAYRKRTGRDPMRYFAIGDAEAVVEHIAAYVAAGVSKFILRPAARGDDELLSQTRRLIEEVLPLVAARWPKPLKRSAPALAAQAAG